MQGLLQVLLHSLSSLFELTRKSDNSFFFWEREREKEKVRVQVTAALLIFIQRTRKVTLSSDKCLGLTWKAYVLVKGKKTSEGPPLAASISVMDQKIFLDISCLGSVILTTFVQISQPPFKALLPRGRHIWESTESCGPCPGKLSLSHTHTHTFTYNIREFLDLLESMHRTSSGVNGPKAKEPLV